MARAGFISASTGASTRPKVSGKAGKWPITFTHTPSRLSHTPLPSKHSRCDIVAGVGNYEWAQVFRQCWDKAVETYRAGNRQPASYFTSDETAFLASIGCSAQEMYDFAEDSEELSFDTALLITAARRDFFLVVQECRPSRLAISVDEFPAKEAELAGFGWL